MVPGKFINFYLPYIHAGMSLSPQLQAEQIIIEATSKLKQGAAGVVITYSANYGQTRTIESTYLGGGWFTHTTGANQAMVMFEMEALMGRTYTNLRGKLRIAPISTMNAYSDPVTPWNDFVQLGIVTQDLDRIKNYLDNGWYVLGWQNQDTCNNPTHPYAVGGSIASMPVMISDRIQQTLISYSKTYV
jgi:hypothetical protein